jgi:hypothetical protein
MATSSAASVMRITLSVSLLLQNRPRPFVPEPRRRLATRFKSSCCLRDSRLESIATTSEFGRLTFWFSPPTRLAPDDVNRPATELLLAATRFTAPTVPLMRGRIVLTSHDSSGNPAGLEDWSARRAILIGTLRWAYHVVLQRNTGHPDLYW